MVLCSSVTVEDVHCCSSPSRGSPRQQQRLTARPHFANTDAWINCGSGSAFNACVLPMLAVDLLVCLNDTHEVALKEAASWSIVRMALAFASGAGVYLRLRPAPELRYLLAHLIEKARDACALSVLTMFDRAFEIISDVMSTPITEPEGPTCLAARAPVRPSPRVRVYADEREPRARTSRTT